MTIPEHSSPNYLENNVRIIVIAPGLRRVLFHGIIRLLYYSTTIKLLSLLILIKGFYLSVKASLLCWEIAFSLVAAVARKFKQCRHAGWYL